MKRFICIALILACITVLGSCGGNGDEKKDEAVKESTAAPKDAESTDEVKEEEDFDFSNVAVKGFQLVNEGDVTDARYSASGGYCSSKPSIASVADNGKITAHTPGVTLIGYEGEDGASAFVLCVFAKGEGADRSAGDPLVFEGGESFVLTGNVSATEYYSSNERVVDITNAPELLFGESGYAVVTAANASRPFFYSFLVYDRECE